ncbi:helix-turn-helix transcriptional regulator [Pantoea sp. GD03673]|uniref:ArsR/SmtB family transcription factor n=1 Tax=Pantoea sp. GD03673 TaxID=2975364 RepID=UPI0024489873|nr:helix-turn-helix transcriptional regulator [Pantoea sp. GD03673]MDH2067062.1 ArsR family transcriptional regulator [Pantoea sp. GD03673]
MSPENALKLLSNPTRVAVLKWLKNPDEAFAGYSQLYPFEQYGVCASLIQDKAGLSQPATSLCLKALHNAGLVEASKVGKWTYYRRAEPRIREITDVVTQSLQTL